MCLIIHRPAGAVIPEALLESAAAFNPHGFGVMSYTDHAGVRVERHARSRLDDILRACRAHADHEYVLHLRYRTRGSLDLANVQPLRVTRDIALAHNGTLDLAHGDVQRSDTWHFVQHYLRPILQRRAETLHDRAFQELVRQWAGQNNRFVFMDARSRRTVIINAEAGRSVDGLWFSNTRWFDASRFDWHRATQPAPPARAMEFFA